MKKMFCNINVFAITFDQFNASLLNKCRPINLNLNVETS